MNVSMIGIVMTSHQPIVILTKGLPRPGPASGFDPIRRRTRRHRENEVDALRCIGLRLAPGFGFIARHPDIVKVTQSVTVSDVFAVLSLGMNTTVSRDIIQMSLEVASTTAGTTRDLDHDFRRAVYNPAETGLSGRR